VPLREASVSAGEGRRCRLRGPETLAAPARVVFRLGALRCPATCPVPAPSRLVLRTALCGPAAWRTRLLSCHRGTLVSCPCGLGWLGRTLVWSSLVDSPSPGAVVGRVACMRPPAVHVGAGSPPSLWCRGPLNMPPSHWCCGGVWRVCAPARRARWRRLTSITLVPWPTPFFGVCLHPFRWTPPSPWCCGGARRVYALARRTLLCRLTYITLVPWLGGGVYAARRSLWWRS